MTTLPPGALEAAKAMHDHDYDCANVPPLGASEHELHWERCLEDVVLMLEAAAPLIAAAERERIRQPLCAPGGFPPNLICMACLHPVCHHCGGCECAETPALCLREEVP